MNFIPKINPFGGRYAPRDSYQPIDPSDSFNDSIRKAVAVNAQSNAVSDNMMAVNMGFGSGIFKGPNGKASIPDMLQEGFGDTVDYLKAGNFGVEDNKVKEAKLLAARENAFLGEKKVIGDKINADQVLINQLEAKVLGDKKKYEDESKQVAMKRADMDKQREAIDLTLNELEQKRDALRARYNALGGDRGESILEDMLLDENAELSTKEILSKIREWTELKSQLERANKDLAGFRNRASRMLDDIERGEGELKQGEDRLKGERQQIDAARAKITSAEIKEQALGKLANQIEYNIKETGSLLKRGQLGVAQNIDAFLSADQLTASKDKSAVTGVVAVESVIGNPETKQANPVVATAEVKQTADALLSQALKVLDATKDSAPSTIGSFMTGKRDFDITNKRAYATDEIIAAVTSGNFKNRLEKQLHLETMSPDAKQFFFEQVGTILVAVCGSDTFKAQSLVRVLRSMQSGSTMISTIGKVVDGFVTEGVMRDPSLKDALEEIVFGLVSLIYTSTSNNKDLMLLRLLSFLDFFGFNSIITNDVLMALYNIVANGVGGFTGVIEQMGKVMLEKSNQSFSRYSATFSNTLKNFIDRVQRDWE
jgi:hypothetical protein